MSENIFTDQPVTFLDGIDTTNDITENETINQVLLYINKNVTRNLSLDELSEQFRISKFYLCKQFKNYTGITIYQYIMKKRLILSLDMLRKGTPVTVACRECGFNDYSNYLKAFKREFGKNPKDFLKVTG